MCIIITRYNICIFVCGMQSDTQVKSTVLLTSLWPVPSRFELILRQDQRHITLLAKQRMSLCHVLEFVLYFSHLDCFGIEPLDNQELEHAKEAGPCKETLVVAVTVAVTEL